MRALHTDFNQVTRDHYITGAAAVNFPWQGITTGGWHHLAFWDRCANRVRIALAGIHYPSTSAYLGEQGVVDASHELKRRGWTVDRPIFMATHFRATADLAIAWARGQSPYCNVELIDWFAEEQDLKAMTDLLRSTLNELDPTACARLKHWLTEQIKTAR